jgi:phosphoribosylformylglycinamidine synthase
MAFTGHCGVEADIAALGDDRLAALFNEELGAVIQVRAADREAVEAILAVNGLADCVHYLGKAVEGDRFVLTADGQTVFSESRTTLRMWWAETTWQMQRLRDNPACADQEHEAKANDADPGLNVKLSFDINDDRRTVHCHRRASESGRPARAGVNSHVEMAAAFHRAGFDAIDVHMSDLLAGRTGLAISMPWWPAAASPTATCWARVRAGRSRFCSTSACAMSSRPSSIVRRPWRSACATAVR